MMEDDEDQQLKDNKDEDYLLKRRARTALQNDQDDMPCQNCKKSHQPEWIFLCDTCNQGWHASCLRPPLMIIPDRDWYCPTCQHSSLLDSLKGVLKRYDEELKRKCLVYVAYVRLEDYVKKRKLPRRRCTQNQINGVYHDFSDFENEEHANRENGNSTQKEVKLEYGMELDPDSYDQSKRKTRRINYNEN